MPAVVFKLPGLELQSQSWPRGFGCLNHHASSWPRAPCSCALTRGSSPRGADSIPVTPASPLPLPHVLLTRCRTRSGWVWWLREVEAGRREWRARKGPQLRPSRLDPIPVLGPHPECARGHDTEVRSYQGGPCSGMFSTLEPGGETCSGWVLFTCERTRKATFCTFCGFSGRRGTGHLSTEDDASTQNLPPPRRGPGRPALSSGPEASCWLPAATSSTPLTQQRSLRLYCVLLSKMLEGKTIWYLP